MKTIKAYKKILNKINKLAPTMKAMSDKELSGMTEGFKERLKNGESLDKIMVEAYAAIREAADRVLGMYPRDVQIMGAIALHQGKIAEMKTGEGKTLVAAMPLYLNALTGKSTILVTMNNYLACRDGKQMGELFKFMGLTTRVGVKEDMAKSLTLDEKKAAYGADILYTTNGTLGFDYLMENLGATKNDRFLRPFYYVIIDEADSVLLDSAQTPLVISGAPRVLSNLYETADFFVTTLKEEDYEVDLKQKKAYLTDSGIDKAQLFYGKDNLYSKENFELVRHILLALRARMLNMPQRDYIVDDGKIKLLDSGTGRIMENTKLRLGQHQALEAREHVTITQETRAMASITFQAFFNMFPKLAGMSGTASDDTAEFIDIYGLDVVKIPTFKPVCRKDFSNICFYKRKDQISAALDETIKIHEMGRPVLLITDAIDVCEQCSERLLREGIPHNVLNAYNVVKEAEIIKEAGRKGAVTIATSVAGRGTDIRLGEGVNEMGGLAVIGIGISGNLRSEKQARGRAGRQGDNGSSVFYTSLEDQLVQDFGPEKLQEISEKGTGRIKSAWLARQIRKAQKSSELAGRDARKATTNFAESAKVQRDLIYSMRNNIIDMEGMDTEYLLGIQEHVIDRFLEKYKTMPTVAEVVRFILDHVCYDLRSKPDDGDMQSKKSLKKYLMDISRERLDTQKQLLKSDASIAYFFKIMTLKALDDCWIEQVDYMQQLRMTVSGRAYAQRNVMFEYHKEAHASFLRMVENVKESMMRNILLGEIQISKDGKKRVVNP
ncbi:MAG: accessory Sec system translocase SecA2 [Butyrivibrio sp.]|uniref:accessory Sec system translocase SecA2 n=1 Tax=Butyrivibrio sp. TaxID=28121 RepID=UPI001B5E20C8|nr:accessory Sec system translocase SecA2 [Butyrivibrio sp.]MBP3783420.1 accessory Sec system translocase SecA2 [Butyrivibrio sp.]